MLKLLFLASVLTLGICVVPHGKIGKIFADFDYNNNDIINQNEVIAFFHNLKAKPADTMVTKTTFVANWKKTYADTTVVTEKLFEKMDMNNDGLLTDADVPLFYSAIDKNRNGIEWLEFEAVFNEWYAASQ